MKTSQIGLSFVILIVLITFRALIKLIVSQINHFATSVSVSYDAVVNLDWGVSATKCCFQQVKEIHLSDLTNSLATEKDILSTHNEFFDDYPLPFAVRNYIRTNIGS
jgi:hypothetical protein